MSPEQFTYWLQGYLEIENPQVLEGDKLKMIKDHLNLVFTKVTPYYPLRTLTTNTAPLPSNTILC